MYLLCKNNELLKTYPEIDWETIAKNEPLKVLPELEGDELETWLENEYFESLGI